MLFYLYLLTTSFHFQNGMSLIGLTTDIDKEYNYFVTKYQDTVDPWKFVAVYNSTELPIDVYEILTENQNYFIDKYNLRWFNISEYNNIDHLFYEIEISFTEIPYYKLPTYVHHIDL